MVNENAKVKTMSEIVCFTISLDGEYERLYNELLARNPSELVHEKLIHAGFHKLVEMQIAGQL